MPKLKKASFCAVIFCQCYNFSTPGKKSKVMLRMNPPGPQPEVPAQQCYLQYPGHRRAFRECHSIYRKGQQTISATVHKLGLGLGTHIYII